MGPRRTLSVVVAVCATLGVAHAEDAGVVRVGGPCTPPGTTLPEILRLLQAELAPARVVVAGSPELAPSSADVAVGIEACTESPPAARVTVSSHGAHGVRVVDLTDAAPGTRDRTMALALAEALRGLPSPPALPPAPVAGPSPVAEPARAPAVEARAAEGVAPGSAAPGAPDPGPSGADEGAPRHVALPSVALRASLVGRLSAAQATPFVGIDVGVAWKRVGASALLLGTRRDTELGAATLGAIAAAGTLDAVELGPIFKVRTTGELGVAVGSGSPGRPAAGHTVAGSHIALGAGLAGVVPLGAAWALDAFLGGGHAWSLTASVDGRPALGLDGWFAAATLGVRAPLLR
jgi:hypothetical protein